MKGQHFFVWFLFHNHKCHSVTQLDLEGLGKLWDPMNCGESTKIRESR